MVIAFNGITGALVPFSYLVYYTCKCIFQVSMSSSLTGVFPRKEGDIQVLAGLAHRYRKSPK
jgi:hypothetical protein